VCVGGGRRLASTTAVKVSGDIYYGCTRLRLQLRLEAGTFSKFDRNPAPAKIPPEPDSFAGFEKSIFPRH